ICAPKGCGWSKKHVSIERSICANRGNVDNRMAGDVDIAFYRKPVAECGTVKRARDISAIVNRERTGALFIAIGCERIDVRKRQDTGSGELCRANCLGDGARECEVESWRRATLH